MRKLVLFVLVAGLLGATAIGVADLAMADPDLTLQAPPHRHFIRIGDKSVEVGPRYCDNLDNPAIKKAFTEFHANLHTMNGVTGEIGPVAPGLHNLAGAEIVSGPC
jgi:hypothetical protein